jgi:hypothetical protein
MAVLASKHFDLIRGDDDQWFDPILDHDTKLFLDPFLIFKRRVKGFENAHDELVKFFNEAFKLAAESRGKRHHPAHQKLESMLLFPEASEFCLGYAGAGNAGAGTARGFARLIAAAILESISQGIQEVSHFEEIGLLHGGIGADRISDMTANVLKGHFIRYTIDVCKRHKMPVVERRIRNSSFNWQFMQWETETAWVPWNPCYDRPLLFTPSSFLRRLPTISPEGFWDFLGMDENQSLRSDLNYLFTKQVKKADIIQLAKEKRFLVRQYLDFTEKKAKAVPYDLDRDKGGLYQWAQATEEYVEQHPRAIAASDEKSFENAITSMANEYRLFVEDNAGYKLLWDRSQTRPKTEEAAQLLFLGLIKSHCQANDIDVSKEVNIGRGPVDFKFSSGYQHRALLEVKLASNGKFRAGLEKQLTKYLDAEGIGLGFFLVVQHRQEEDAKIQEIKKIVDGVQQLRKVRLRVIVVDATPHKPSASKL